VQRVSQSPRMENSSGTEFGGRSRRGATEETIRVEVLGDSFAWIRPAVMAAVARDSRAEFVVASGERERERWR
jgi:hypothetical protein